MRHKKKGRRLGRTSSHRRALYRNMATALFLTERDEMYYEDLTQPDGRAVNAPAVKGRIITTITKAKEIRPYVEKCITLAKKALPHQREADKLACEHEKGSDAWKKWRDGDGWQKWNQAIAPAIDYRRRAFAMLRDKEAVQILFDDLAERFENRPGGYTRIMRLAKPRLGDNGTRAILELVGERDRVVQKSEKPAFAKEESKPAEKPAKEEAPAAAAADSSTEEAPKSPKGLGFDNLKVVEGIGPKCEEALKAAGIDSWKALADSTPEKITEILTAAEGNFSGQVPTTWPEQAGMAVAGDWDKLEKWQDELDGGKPPADKA